MNILNRSLRAVRPQVSRPDGALLLTCPSNPHGWEIEDLAEQLIAELTSEVTALDSDRTDVAVVVRAAHERNIASLRSIIGRAANVRRIRECDEWTL
jgi:hypothetical protein